ncbi:hypothetical protein M6D93_05440 [Jatrophihabitans telluris]|uniref:Lipoprotein n=1 Tax=Jatrophihabitans telluris TaxID=2038343 RepID=A0ABY4R0S8_9ACTN|nr:hypothetical protein [Jatrophihabitans telluris]UQX89449.1 hypothetical protein M6D93_05440 [Jatrophihabitans telluris]
MLKRLWIVAALSALLLTAGCQRSARPGGPSTTGSVVGTAHSSSPGLPSRSRSGTPVPSGSAGSGPAPVAVDQIPPGRPATWLPPGVQVDAPFKEPGDKVPMFTLAMFTHDEAGALATATYYVDAVNWSGAMLSTLPIEAICDDSSCVPNRELLSSLRRAHQHFRGGRISVVGLRTFRPDPPDRAERVIRVRIASQKAAIVTAGGQTVRSVSSGIVSNDLYLKWSGAMWRIIGVYLTAPS